MFKISPLAQVDSYKLDHRTQYATGTEKVYSNFTPRNNRYAKLISPLMSDKVVHYGLQAILMAYVEEMDNQFFKVDKAKAVATYKRRVDKICGKDVISMDHIADLHDYGRIPLTVKALPEGTLVDMKIPTFTITNTDPKFFWMVNYVESMLSNLTWKACTAAAIAFSYKKLLSTYAIKTGTPLEAVDFQSHEFAFRGLSGIDDACLAGSAHATSFLGSDNVAFPEFIENFYCFTEDEKDTTYSMSIPATEHSVMCLGIEYNIQKNLVNGIEIDKEQAELELFKELATVKYPSGMLAIVSDTFDFWRVITSILPALKDDILARKDDVNGMSKVVIRPDSGDPVHIVAGYRVYECDELTAGASKYYIAEWLEHTYPNKYDVLKLNGQYWKLNSLDTSVAEHEVKGAIQCLWETFGGTTQFGRDGKEYKQLNSKIGLIYGDSITLERADAILGRLAEKGFASGNVVFGVGSYTYSLLTRDTYGFAIKATYGVVNGIPLNLAKDPATDDGLKKSAKGLLRVEKVIDSNEPEGYRLELFEDQTENQEQLGELKTILDNGELVNLQTFDEIKGRLDEALKHTLK